MNKRAPLQETKHLPALDRWTPAFVWGIWAIMLLAALAFGRKYAPGLPWGEEWFYIVPNLTGERPISITWLWQPEGTHRIPLPKLVWLALIGLSGRFTVGMYFNVLTLGLLSASMILAARALRGRVAYTDAFFPVALLHWGQWPNLLTTFQLHQVVPVFLACTLLALIVRNRKPFTGRTAILAGLCLILLPFCGSVGLAHVPVLSLWLAGCGVLALYSSMPHCKRDGPLMLAFALAGLAMVVIYFVGLDQSPNQGRTWQNVLAAATQYMSLSFGHASRSLWPYSTVFLIGLVLFSWAALVGLWRRRPSERFRALGLLAFTGASACLVLAVGWGRYDGTVLDDRYVTIGVPGVCAVYFIWVAYGGPIGRMVQMLLFTLICAVFSLNTYHGLNVARWLRDERLPFEEDLSAGIPASTLAQYHIGWSTFFPSAIDSATDQRIFAAWWRRARQAGMNSLRSLQPIEGAIECASVDQISGWAWNMDQPGTALRVDIYTDGTLIATAAANQFREELRDTGVGDGRHGFSLLTPDTLKDGKARVIRAEASGTGRVVGVAVLHAEDGIQGKLGMAARDLVTGWAWDRGQPDICLMIDIYADDTRIATVLADEMNEDLRDKGVGDGRHGYRFRIPDTLKDGKPRIIRAEVAGTGRVIGACTHLAPFPRAGP